MKYLVRATTQRNFVDLHNHTDLSYGPEMGKMDIMPLDLLEEMREYSETTGQIVTFSITDHNDVIANRVIMREMEEHPEKYKKVRYIPGVEYSVSADSIGVCYDNNGKQQPIIKDNRVHLLAYGLDTYNPDVVYLNTLMSNSKRYSVKFDDTFIPIKMGNIIFTSRHWLKKIGIKLELSDFRKTCPLQDSFDANMQLVEKFFRENLQLTEDQINEWKAYMGDHRNLTRHTKADIMEVMDIVEQAGGFCVLAHPLSYVPSQTFQSIARGEATDPRNCVYKNIAFDDTNYKTMNIDEKRKNLRAMENYYNMIYRKLSVEAKNPITGKPIHGIIGHELLHPLNQTNPYKFQIIIEAGDKYGLYCTGGSDSHGDLYKYIIPSRIAGALVQHYDTDYPPTISAYSLFYCRFAEDYFKYVNGGDAPDRKLGQTANGQVYILKTDENGSKFYDMTQFEEVVFTSFKRRKYDFKNNQPETYTDAIYDEAERQSMDL